MLWDQNPGTSMNQGQAKGIESTNLCEDTVSITKVMATLFVVCFLIGVVNMFSKIDRFQTYTRLASP